MTDKTNAELVRRGRARRNHLCNQLAVALERSERDKDLADHSLERAAGDIEMLTTERDALSAELDEARKVVERLPKTADGVPVVPGRDHLWRIGQDGNPESSCQWSGWGMKFLSEMPPGDGGGFWPAHVVEEDCYSTRAAAEAAKDTST